MKIVCNKHIIFYPDSQDGWQQIHINLELQLDLPFCPTKDMTIMDQKIQEIDIRADYIHIYLELMCFSPQLPYNIDPFKQEDANNFRKEEFNKMMEKYKKQGWTINEGVKND